MWASMMLWIKTGVLVIRNQTVADAPAYPEMLSELQVNDTTHHMAVALHNALAAVNKCK